MAGHLVLDSSGRVLIGQTSYDSGYWTIPGGVVEKDESPRAAAIRETREEIGLVVEASSLVAVHYIGDANVPDRLILVFLGGILSATEASHLSIPKDQSEWVEFKFVVPREADQILSPELRRVVQWSTAVYSGTTCYLEL